MKLRVHYVMHASYETPGSIEHWAKERGHVLSGTHAHEDQLLPDSRDIDFLIVVGGPQSALRIGNFRYLRDEIDLVIGLPHHERALSARFGLARGDCSFFDEGNLRVAVNRSYALADAPEAHRALEAGEVTGRIVLDIP
jgi:hypothetical protein